MVRSQSQTETFSSIVLNSRLKVNTEIPRRWVLLSLVQVKRVVTDPVHGPCVVWRLYRHLLTYELIHSLVSTVGSSSSTTRVEGGPETLCGLYRRRPGNKTVASLLSVPSPGAQGCRNLLVP